jgi:hypothetical protein
LKGVNKNSWWFIGESFLILYAIDISVEISKNVYVFPGLYKMLTYLRNFRYKFPIGSNILKTMEKVQPNFEITKFSKFKFDIKKSLGSVYF